VSVAFALLCLSLALLVYAWLLFPAIIQMAARRGACEGPRPPDSVKPPKVDIVIAAHNEADHIADRVRNILALDYPQDRIRVLIGVDGSDDDTAACARSVADAHDHIHVEDFLVRRGKVPVLKDLVAQCEASLIVFSDANTMFKKDALNHLLRPMQASPSLGGVCGRLVLGREDVHETDRDTEEGFYWGWETDLKVSESRLDSCLGANGAIFVIRRELFWDDIPENTLVDDFVIGMKVREQGARFIFEPKAVAFEALPELKDEWARRVRIGAGDFQALRFCSRCLHPSFGWFALSFWSHKVLRWVTPLLGIVATLCALALMNASEAAPRILSWLVLAAVGLALVVALIGRLMARCESPLARVPRLGWHFVSMQLALLFGFVRFCRGNLGGQWKRTPRTQAP
jgi:cellulose synthase/poly-beta-1,6-N-acetylglucosamine synthase-like glycosyltransferase